MLSITSKRASAKVLVPPTSVRVGSRAGLPLGSAYVAHTKNYSGLARHLGGDGGANGNNCLAELRNKGKYSMGVTPLAESYSFNTADMARKASNWIHVAQHGVDPELAFKQDQWSKRACDMAYSAGRISEEKWKADMQMLQIREPNAISNWNKDGTLTASDEWERALNTALAERGWPQQGSFPHGLFQQAADPELAFKQDLFYKRWCDVSYWKGTISKEKWEADMQMLQSREPFTISNWNEDGTLTSDEEWGRAIREALAERGWPQEDGVSSWVDTGQSGSNTSEHDYSPNPTTHDAQLAEDIYAAMLDPNQKVMNHEARDEATMDENKSHEETNDIIDDDSFHPSQRTHPLTAVNRFSTDPSTIEIPKSELVDPVENLLSRAAAVHVSETAHRVFGGVGLPYSTATPNRGKTMQQKPIALNVLQPNMSPIEADAFIATLIPAMYASVLSALTETRKRLGTPWIEEMTRKAERGELKILDVGGAGAGILAVQHIFAAEWTRMHEKVSDASTAVVEPTGTIGGASTAPPLGSATVVIGPDTLRQRMGPLLDNTTFIPRLPDYVHTSEQNKTAGKFDIIVAPHFLWTQDTPDIKAHVSNLWNMLVPDGGVLLMLEKGIPRGFECIASARDWLLDRHIHVPTINMLKALKEEWGREKFDDYFQDSSLQQMEQSLKTMLPPKEVGMIVAPCTNHTSCPLYERKGIVKGRADVCSFAQRYHRPAFLQKIYNTKGKNHEDAEFSYLSVVRGRDLRVVQHRDSTGRSHPVVIQGDKATNRAFRGYEDTTSNSPSKDEQNTGEPQQSSSLPLPPAHSLSLPRAVFPPLKRHGHVIIDVCTPSGTLERWTVPKSFSRQAYRDARKSSWGDLWALGAKTRVPRNIKATPRRRDNKRSED